MAHRILSVALVILAFQASLSAQVTVEPWLMHDGGAESIIEHPTHSVQEFEDAFKKASIPTEGWVKATVDKDGTVTVVRDSVVNNKQQVDFSYFKTTVTAPAGGVKEFKITFGAVDDAIRVYVNGQSHPDADIIGVANGIKTLDLKGLVKEGKNEVVVVQFDQHRPGNTVAKLALEVNGEALIPGSDALTVTPWEVHDAEGGALIDFETRTDEQRADAFTKATIPAKDDKGWKPAEMRKDGDVMFLKGSEIKKNARQLDFTYFQAFVKAPKGGG